MYVFDVGGMIIVLDCIMVCVYVCLFIMMMVEEFMVVFFDDFGLLVCIMEFV